MVHTKPAELLLSDLKLSRPTERMLGYFVTFVQCKFYLNTLRLMLEQARHWRPQNPDGEIQETHGILGSFRIRV